MNWKIAPLALSMAQDNNLLDKKPPYRRIKSDWFFRHSKQIIDELGENLSKGLTVSGNQDYRKSDVYLYDIWNLNLSDFKKVVVFKIKEIFIQENKIYNYDLDYSTVNVQLTRYRVGEFYEWHSDDLVLNTYKKYNNVRKLTISTPLNIGEFEGGDFEIMLMNNRKKINFEPGNALIFPSFIEHRVLPVTKNTRYSLVAWISGPPWR